MGPTAGPPTVRIIGPGRAGRAFAVALDRAGWRVDGLLGRQAPVERASGDVDLLVVATPDAAIEEVAASVEPADAVVAHLAGSLGLDVLAPHPRRAAIHPLVPLPDDDRAADRLVGATFAVAGDPIALRVVDDLDGRPIDVADDDRASYHAAASIASNHLVALLGQVERVAAQADVPLDAYLDLVRATVDDVEAMGPAAALTGPVARGDRATVARHLSALDADERPAYEALAAAAAHLVDRAWPVGCDPDQPERHGAGD